ncbi:Sialidase [Trypanosoma melophagium]|uniref:Sialidase n=1 Tax=Trypanosoma melophagium TaxID=715481 RepID=UPI00351A61D5|nr:Sialidase [Trypanosoma melophagium]
MRSITIKNFGDLSLMVAFVESDCAAVPKKDSPKFASEKGEKCTLRILKVQSLNDETERYWLSYTPLNVTFPFMSGTATVVGFPFDTTTAILRMKNYGFVFPLQFITKSTEVISTVVVSKYEDEGWAIGRPLPDMGTYNPALLDWEDDKLMVRCCDDEACTSLVNCRIPTTGLVSYLSGSIDEDKWNDEYLCVNAVIKGAPIKAPSGDLTFIGLGEGAIWPLSTSGLANQYYFANYIFTLAATVTIHAVPEESTPLLGVRLKVVAPASHRTSRVSHNKGRKSPDPNILLGVSYNNDTAWGAQYRNELYNTKIPQWEVCKTYSVVLTFKNGKGFVHIIGTRLSVPYYSKREESEVISHFYFGEYNEGESASSMKNMGHVKITVRDVLLYNRVLLRGEIGTLNTSRMGINVPRHRNNRN